MHVIYGFIALMVSVVGSYLLLGGKMAVLFQPFELTLILGAGVSAFYIGNTPNTTRSALSSLARVRQGPRFKSEDYLDLLSMMYQVFRAVRMQGNLALEKHIDNPENSDIFRRYARIQNCSEFQFFIDYCRLIVVGSDNAFEIETLIDQEIDIIRQENNAAVHSLTVLGESFPALGIVAAVLGVIKAMGAVTEPPEVLGGLIGSALVGTFLGVFLSYGIFTPLAMLVKQIKEDEGAFLQCMKTGIVAHLRGTAPTISVEYARKMLHSHYRPDFYELEDAIGKVPSTTTN